MTFIRWELFRAISCTSFDASKKWQIHFYTLVYPCLTPRLRLLGHLEDARFRGYLERTLELNFPIEVGM